MAMIDTKTIINRILVLEQGVTFTEVKNAGDTFQELFKKMPAFVTGSSPKKFPAHDFVSPFKNYR